MARRRLGDIIAKGRRMRVGLLLLRTAGFSVKESAALLGLTVRAADYYWSEVQETTGIRSQWKLAEMVRSTPQSQWPL